MYISAAKIAAGIKSGEDLFAAIAAALPLSISPASSISFASASNKIASRRRPTSFGSLPARTFAFIVF